MGLHTNAEGGTEGSRTPVDRRRFLRGATTVGAGLALAGCSTDVGDFGDGGDGGDGGGDGGGGDATPTSVGTEPPLTPADCDPEPIESDITSDTTWDASDCPRVALETNVRVTSGATLTIEPGVEVVGKPGSKLTVKGDGTLVASGSASDPIWFYGDSRVPAHWQTIEIESENPNELSNVVVHDAGGGDWANVWVQGGARLSVTDSWFANSGTWGLVAEDGATLDFARNAFTGNETAPLSVSTTLVGALDGVSLYAGGNGTDHIEVSAADVESEATWPATDAPFFFEGNSRLLAPVSVDRGARFTFAEGGKLTVKPEGSLAASGTSERPIVFEGDEEVPGYWQTIEFESNNPDNELSNVVVRDAGGGDWANVWVQGGARLSVSNSTFANSATWGLVAEDGATLPEFATNTFTGNETAPLSVSTTLVGALDAGSTYAGDNGADRIEVDGTDVESEATWPATDAPIYLQGNSRLFAPVSVDSGAQFTFAEGGKLTVKPEGALSADAGDGEPIVFEGAEQSPGYWQTIEFESNNPDNVLDNVEVAYGGGGDWANVWVQNGARLSLTNSRLANSATWGLVVEGGATFEGRNNVYENNAEGGIRDDTS
ncbi:twin-arginine translocation signal domain-containing protein [Haloglomus salinum]|jgi:hypothetical protein|uniref:twin-arginine translocation signal domain-containing protein n=1 Tax=Haloglomus salinum TaxID=2962673 RepID=UPI0020C95E8C|nr:twin-arginine translocation signal domain-containing protein [Haloglomus salinum]